MTWNSKVDIIPDITRKSIYHTYRLCYLTQKGNHHGNEAEPSSIEKYLRTLMAKKLHGALLVPQNQYIS